MSDRVILTVAQVRRYRAAAVARHRVRSRRGALAFVNAVGFCYAFTPGPGGLPGLFDVLATRSVDRMWEWAWRWKDELATARRLYYGRVLRRKPTYISLEYLPHFYALSGNVGEPDDYLQAYREGRLSRLAADICGYVHEHGPCDTWTLRRRYVGAGSTGAAFHRALAELQAHFLICKVAEREDGSYSYVWDTVPRWLPHVVEAASRIPAARAAAAVLGRYLRTVGAASPADVCALFGWSPRLLLEARAAAAAREVEVDGRPALAHPDLLRWGERRR